MLVKPALQNSSDYNKVVMRPCRWKVEENSDFLPHSESIRQKCCCHLAIHCSYPCGQVAPQKQLTHLYS